MRLADPRALHRTAVALRHVSTPVIRVVTVPGAGHNLMFVNPDAFVAVVAGRL